MKVLVAFEESQIVTMAFRAYGHEAFSNDILPCSGGYPDFHLQYDAIQAMRGASWDLIIMHPPCTYTAICGNRWYYNSQERIEGIALCKMAWDTAKESCLKIALEQPKTIMPGYIGPKSQVIHPWQFGHGETKETWLWLKGLPILTPTDIVEGREQRIWKMPPTKDPGERRKLRSRTYPGIALAMAEQWG